VGQSCTLRLDPRAERCAWEGPDGAQDVGLPEAEWEVVPDGLLGRDAEGTTWELGVAVSAPVGWLLRDGVPVEGYGEVARVADERARRLRHATADRLADATLAEGDPAIAELLEWAKLGLPDPSVALPVEDATSAWLAWWTARGCRAAVPREAHAAALQALFGLSAAGDGMAHLAPRLPATWPGWRIERWRLGRSVLDVSVTRRGDLRRCRLLPRHGPVPVLSIVPESASGAAVLVDGEPVAAREVRLELREPRTLEWDVG